MNNLSAKNNISKYEFIGPFLHVCYCGADSPVNNSSHVNLPINSCYSALLCGEVYTPTSTSTTTSTSNQILQRVSPELLQRISTSIINIVLNDFVIL